MLARFAAQTVCVSTYVHTTPQIKIKASPAVLGSYRHVAFFDSAVMQVGLNFVSLQKVVIRFAPKQ